MKTPIRLSPEDAHRMMRESDALLLDVRTPAEFAAVHAADATNVPLPELANRHGELPADRPLITVCASGQRSRLAAAQLAALGRNVLGDIEGGTGAWEAAGLPVEKSGTAPPMSLERQVRLFAGIFVAVFSALGFVMHPAFHYGAAFVGVMLTVTAALGICPMMDALQLLPWNRVPNR